MHMPQQQQQHAPPAQRQDSLAKSYTVPVPHGLPRTNLRINTTNPMHHVHQYHRQHPAALPPKYNPQLSQHCHKYHQSTPCSTLQPRGSA